MKNLKNAQIKLVKHPYFEGVIDKNNTVRSMLASEAREVLESLGYKKLKEVNEFGCLVEIWELPEHRQTK